MTRSDHYVTVLNIRIPRLPLINVLLVLSGLAAAWLYWWATALRGIGIQTGSIIYLWVAESLTKGLGFGIAGAFGQARPVTLLPPLYPWLLWLSHSSFTLIDPAITLQNTARILGAVLSGATIWVFGWVAARVSSRSVSFVIFGVAILLSSAIFWDSYFYILPHQLFLFLCLCALYLFLDYFRTFMQSTLFWASVFVGLAVLARYEGLFLIPLMAGAILFLTGRAMQKKILAINHLLAFGLLPAMVWGIRGFFVQNPYSSLNFGLHGISFPEWRQFVINLLDWYTPLASLMKVPPAGIVYMLAFTLLVGSVLLYYNRRIYGNNESQELWWVILILFIASYILAILVGRLFFDPTILLQDAHIFLPVYVGVVLLVTALLANAREIHFQVLGKVTFLTCFSIVLIFTALMIALNVTHTSEDLTAVRQSGLTLGSPGDKNSEFWLEIRELNADLRKPIFFTDNVEKLYWATGIAAETLPIFYHNFGPVFDLYLPEHDVVIVLIDRPETGPEVMQSLPQAQNMYKDEQGVIFILHNNQTDKPLCTDC